VTFAGTENIAVEVCDFGGSCVQTNFTISVNNSAPIIDAVVNSSLTDSKVTIDLLDITSDSDNNLDVSTFVIIDGPSSNGAASIVDGVLVIDYTGITWSATDYITIQVCDAAGACSEPVVLAIEGINVESEVPDVIVNNAVAPHGSSPANAYLHISNLPQNNTVSIYNRWGDKVYEASGYNNTTVKFTGQNNDGNDLPSGTYFYKIEYSINGENKKPETGHLALKQ
jgi:gliding motility-associated-like protein